MTTSPMQGSTRVAAPERPDSMVLTGWGTFAAVLLVVVGAMNIVYGLTALNQSEFLVNQVLYSNLDTWGWAFLIWGVLQAVAGVLAFGVNSSAGPAIGIILASVGMVGWFFMMFASPTPALVGILINGAILFGLTARTSNRVH